MVVVEPIVLVTRMSLLVPSRPVDQEVAVHVTVPLQATDALMLEWWALAMPANVGTTTTTPSRTNTAVKIRRNCRIIHPLFRPDIRNIWDSSTDVRVSL